METFQEYFGLPGPLAGGTSLVFVCLLVVTLKSK